MSVPLSKKNKKYTLVSVWSQTEWSPTNLLYETTNCTIKI